MSEDNSKNKIVMPHSLTAAGRSLWTIADPGDLLRETQKRTSSNNIWLTDIADALYHDARDYALTASELRGATVSVQWAMTVPHAYKWKAKATVAVCRIDPAKHAIVVTAARRDDACMTRVAYGNGGHWAIQWHLPNASPARRLTIEHHATPDDIWHVAMGIAAEIARTGDPEGTMDVFWKSYWMSYGALDEGENTIRKLIRIHDSMNKEEKE